MDAKTIVAVVLVAFMPRHSMSFATKRSRLKKIKKTA